MNFSFLFPLYIHFLSLLLISIIVFFNSCKCLVCYVVENKSETEIFFKASKNYSSDEEAMDSKESKCDTEPIESNMSVLDHSTSNLLPEESGCHTQLCKTSDSVVDTELNNLTVVSCNNHVEKAISMRSYSNEVEPEKEPETVMDALPSFPHPAPEFLHGAYGTEDLEFRPQNQSNSELPVTDAVENCNSEKEGEKNLEDKSPRNGIIAHDPNPKKCGSIDAKGLNSNVNQDSIEVSIDVIRHLNTTGKDSYVSSGVCENGSGADPSLYSVASNKSTSQEKFDLLDQLPATDSTKTLVGTNSTNDALLSKLKESTPGINQQFSANSEVGNDCHDNVCDVSIAEKDLGVVESVHGFDISSINQASKMVK